MNKDKINNIQLLGTLHNSDESGIIANANQIYDSVANKSVEERISDLDNKIESVEGLKVKVTDNILQFTIQFNHENNNKIK